MNSSPEMVPEKEDPWKNIGSGLNPERRSIVLAGVLYLLSSALIPLCFYQPTYASIAAVALLAGAFFLTGRMRSGVLVTIPACFLVSVAAVFFTDDSGLLVSIGVLTAALCVGVMSGCFFVTALRRCWCAPILFSLVAAGIVYVLIGEWLPVLCALVLFPASLLLAFATVSGEYRTTAICYAMGGLMLSGVGILLFWLFQEYGNIRINTLYDVWGSLREQMILSRITMRDEYISLIKEMLSDPAGSEAYAQSAGKMLEMINQTMSDEIIVASVTIVFDLMPAILCIACEIPAFCAQKLLNGAYASQGMRNVLTPESEFFTMSVPGAVIFIVSLIVMMLPGLQDIAVVVAENLCFILLPGFILLGARVWFGRISAMRGGARAMFLLAMLSLLCCSFLGALFLFGFYGAFNRIAIAIRHKIMQKMKDDDSDCGE